MAWFLPRSHIYLHIIWVCVLCVLTSALISQCPIPTWQSSLFRQEYYTFGESTWDLVLLIGTGTLGPAGAAQTIVAWRSSCRMTSVKFQAVEQVCFGQRIYWFHDFCCSIKFNLCGRQQGQSPEHTIYYGKKMATFIKWGFLRLEIHQIKCITMVVF